MRTEYPLCNTLQDSAIASVTRMVSGKPRLYVALYPGGSSGNEAQRYHWGFLIGPKVESAAATPGIRAHIRNILTEGWKYEEVAVPNVKNTNTLLARILIAKIEDVDRLLSILEHTSIVQGDQAWRCKNWVASALAHIAQDGKAVGTSQLDWHTIEAKATKYVSEKVAAGRYAHGADPDKPRPTLNMLKDKEVFD